MRKSIFFVVLLMAVLFTACSNDNAKETNDKKEESAQITVTEPASVTVTEKPT